MCCNQETALLKRRWPVSPDSVLVRLLAGTNVPSLLGKPIVIGLLLLSVTVPARGDFSSGLEAYMRLSGAVRLPN